MELLELQGAPLGEPTPFCPADDAISAFYDGASSAQQREAVSRHLSECRYCRGRLGLLSRLEEMRDEDSSVAGEYKARAKQLGAQRPARWWKHASGWAAAAVVFVAFGMWIGPILELSSPIAPDDTRELRSVDPLGVKPKILLPTENAVIDPANLKVEWTPVAGSLHYEIYLLSAAGDLLVHERLNETSWVPDETLAIQPAGEYYLRIEAHLDDATTVSSEHVLFKAPGDREQ